MEQTTIVSNCFMALFQDSVVKLVPIKQTVLSAPASSHDTQVDRNRTC